VLFCAVLDFFHLSHEQEENVSTTIGGTERKLFPLNEVPEQFDAEAEMYLAILPWGDKRLVQVIELLGQLQPLQGRQLVLVVGGWAWACEIFTGAEAHEINQFIAKLKGNSKAFKQDSGIELRVPDLLPWDDPDEAALLLEQREPGVNIYCPLDVGILRLMFAMELDPND
jgi:hypothetical protein